MESKLRPIIRLRRYLAQADALPLLAVLGVICGLVTSGTILLFRIAIEGPLNFLLPGNHHENFEALDPMVRLFLPLAGAFMLAIIFTWMSPQMRSVGISHVLERLNKHQGHMQAGNFFAQFIGGVICALSGQSTGREGPAVHLGAASGSLMARKLHLPTHHVHLLLASGVAAAISASFNTPIAGVIFAMEVIIAGYSLISFIPIILASVTGALVTRAIYGSEPAFSVPPLEMRSLLELPFLLVEGFLMGAMAALFIWLCVKTASIAPKNLWIRFGLIGILNGVLALAIPQMMGIGYDTVNLAIFGELTWLTLLMFAFAKLFITSLNLGLGQPGGVIGPMLFIGACIGGLMGEVGNLFAPEQANASGYYAMLGMAAMMSACLQAPLTGLMTLMELTGNPNIILPGMLVVVIANLTTSELFKQKALFPRLLLLKGLAMKSSPVEQMLRQATVMNAANRNVKILNKFSTLDAINEVLKSEPDWIVIEQNDDVIAILSPADVAALLLDEEQLSQWLQTENEEQVLNLMAIPGNRFPTKSIRVQSNLQEALDMMSADNMETLSVHYGTGSSRHSLLGVVRQENIHKYYRYSS